MATIKAKIQSLINKANNTTGKSDTDLTNAVKSLAEGYGQGGEPWDETDPDNIIIEGEPIPEGDTLTEFLKVRGFDYLFYKCDTMTEAPLLNTSEAISVSNMFNGCYALTSIPMLDTSNVTDMSNMLYNCRAITTVPLFNTSKVTNMLGMFSNCWVLTSVPLFDTSNVTNMGGMFSTCRAITTVPLFNTSKVTSMERMFDSCYALTSVPLFDTSNVTSTYAMFNSCYALTTVPLFNTSNVTKTEQMFNNCSNLTTVPALDLRSVTSNSGMFASCKALTEIWVKNIRTSLQVGSGTSYGHLLTVDSLVHLVYELRKQSSSRTLTIASTNLAKLADVYVKAIDITDEMRAEDDLIDEKYPFVRCESTDEGAMLITTYASTIKNWTIK